MLHSEFRPAESLRDSYWEQSIWQARPIDGLILKSSGKSGNSDKLGGRARFPSNCNDDAPLLEMIAT
jgi:hypothetical protein